MLLNSFYRSLFPRVKFSNLNLGVPQIATGNNFGDGLNLLSETSLLNTYLEISLIFFNKL
jgi:hypothetical protein